MLGANVLVVETLRLLIGQLHDLASAVGESFVHLLFPTFAVERLLIKLMKEFGSEDGGHRAATGSRRNASRGVIKFFSSQLIR